MAKLRPILGLIVLAAGILLLATLRPQNARIDWNSVHQQIDGFGVTASEDLPPLGAMTDEQADMLFDPVKGIGLSLLRLPIRPDGSPHEIAIAQKAMARGARVWGAPWSPPAEYKTNHTENNGGYLIRSDYKEWAERLAHYVQLMRSNNVPIYAVSVQNEPDISQSYPSCLYSAQNIHDFVPYLRSALQAAGAEGTKIMVAEASQWTTELASAAMSDPAVAADIGIIAAHGYGNRKIEGFPTGKAHLWQTEVWGDAGVKHFDPSIEEGMIWALNIHEYLTVANVNAWHWWSITTDEDDNGGLTDKNLNPAKRMYVIGQWSKFVRPGWYRIGVNYSGPLHISAFKDPASGAFAIVAVNPNRSTVTQAFSLNGVSPRSIIPWITSAQFSLAAQHPVAIDGASFTYTLPASSVTTFAGAL